MTHTKSSFHCEGVSNHQVLGGMVDLKINKVQNQSNFVVQIFDKYIEFLNLLLKGEPCLNKRKPLCLIKIK